MADTSGDYKGLLTELIQKHMVILGPNIALDKARAVVGLTVADDGSLQQITGDPEMVLKALLKEYGSLSGPVTEKTLKDLLAKYPGLKPV